MCADRFLEGNYPDSPEGLTQEIQKIIDKNQADGKELVMSEFNRVDYSVTLDVEWEFDGVHQKEIKSGNHKTDIHFGYDYQEFDKHFENLMNEAKYGVRLRTPFIDKLISLGKNSLIEYCKKYTFHHYEPFSKTCDCHNCQATGEITCSNCGGKGKKTCWGCGGSGDESYQVPVYDNKGTIRSYQTQYRSCSACFGSGKNKCGDCGGSGNVTCQSCSGQGIFTHIIQVSAIAEPYYGVYIDESYHLKDLQNFLNEKGMDFCAKKIDFKLINHHQTKDNNYQFIYNGKDIQTHLSLIFRDKMYDCYAFSDPPYPYIRPKIFDDLFFDEWQFLKNSFDEKGNIKKVQATLFFHKYMEEPALDKALKDIAKQHNAQMAVFFACEGFISYEMAKNIGNALSHILGAISPRYSKFAWIIFSVPAIVITFIISEYYFQNAFNVVEIIIALFAGLFYSGIYTILIGLLALSMSRLYTYWVNQKIPKEYRLTPDNKTAMRYYIIAVAIAFALGVVYGFLANNEQLPMISSDYYSFLMKIKNVYSSMK